MASDDLLQRLSAIFHPLFDPSSSRSNTSTVLSSLAWGVIGAIVLPSSAKFFAWFRLHFLHRSKLSRYNHTPTSLPASSSLSSKRTPSSSSTTRPWALITGASDGIGYAFATSLAQQNFNIILHGRNSEKLSSQITILTQQLPNIRFESWIVDATRRDRWDEAFNSLLERITSPTDPIRLTVLVNNIGGNPSPDAAFTNLSHYTSTNVNDLIDMNVTFPMQVTRALLPHLISNAPALILNMSSIVATQPIAYLAGYSGSKAFNLLFSRALRLEMLAEGKDTVEVMGVVAARVKSAGSGDIAVNWSTPSSAQFARSALQKVGCGRPVVCGWWSHDVQMWVMSLLPTWLADWVIVKVAREEKRGREEKMKKDAAWKAKTS